MDEDIQKKLWEADSQCGIMGIRKEYIRIAGDLAVGSLLSQIVYWHRPAKNGKSKLRVLIEGKFYVAKTSKDWMDECCLSEAQVKRALQVLKNKGLIEIRLKKFNGTPQNHIRLVPERLCAELELQSKVQKELNQFGENLLSGSVLLTSPDSVETHEPLTETTSEKTTETILCAGSSSSAEAGAKTIKKNEQEEGIGKKDQKDLWKDLMVEFHKGVMKPWASKQRGQYKQVRDKLGPDADIILRHTIKNWIDFGYHVRYSAGINVVPHLPNIGFLLMYAHLAMSMWTEHKEWKVKSQQKSSITSSYLNKPIPIADEDKPYKPSPEEIAKTLEKLGSNSTYKQPEVKFLSKL